MEGGLGDAELCKESKDFLDRSAWLLAQFNMFGETKKEAKAKRNKEAKKGAVSGPEVGESGEKEIDDKKVNRNLFSGSQQFSKNSCNDNDNEFVDVEAMDENDEDGDVEDVDGENLNMDHSAFDAFGDKFDDFGNDDFYNYQGNSEYFDENGNDYQYHENGFDGNVDESGFRGRKQNEDYPGSGFTDPKLDQCGYDFENFNDNETSMADTVGFADYGFSETEMEGDVHCLAVENKVVVHRFVPGDAGWQKRMCRKLDLIFRSRVQYGHFCYFSSSDKPSSTLSIVGDGNCFFRALSLAITGSEDQHSEIRDSIGSREATYPDRYKKFLIRQDDDYGMHVSKMFNTRTWGSQLEMNVASDMLKLPVFLYSNGQWLKHCFWHEYEENYRYAIYLFHKNQNHFEVVTAVDSSEVTLFEMDYKRLLMWHKLCR